MEKELVSNGSRQDPGSSVSAGMSTGDYYEKRWRMPYIENVR